MKTFNYKPYVKSLVKYMLDNGYTQKPLPILVLNDKKQKGVFISTGKYMPSDKLIVLYINERHPKDVLRSLAHELIHHNQYIDGDLTEDMCAERITDSKQIVPLEEEAYLKGNIAFRSWTETFTK